MKRRTAALAATALLAAPAAARADTTTITMPGRFFDPARSTSVAGDLVLFKNQDLSTHNVRIAGGLFNSGPILPFRQWSQRIERPGAYPFICTIHAFMSGNLDVVAATLAARPDQVLAGEPLTLSGRATAGTAHIGVEQSVAGGPWSAAGAGATPAPDGTFTATVAAVEGASYRGTTAAGAGQVVTPRVTARVDVHLQVRRGRRQPVAHVHTMPATTGFTAALELYSRWHFRWRSVRSARLDRHGGAMFRLPNVRRGFARVALRRRARGPALVYSGVVKLPSGKPSADPAMIGSPMPSDHMAEPHHG